MKADRNKTIDMTAAEGREYLERCISISEKKTIDETIKRVDIRTNLQVRGVLHVEG